MRLRPLILLAVILPAAVGAQQPSAARSQPPASPITDTFKGFGYYGGWLLAAFDSIPASRYGFKPTPAQQSVGYIAQHLENANYQLCDIIGGTRRSMTARDSLPDTVKAAWPKDTLVARLRASLVFCRDALDRLNDAKLAEEVTVGPPDNRRTAFRVRWVVLLLTDLAEHYAQLASYMRLMGMVPPSALPGR
jgi:hypothetical protein